MYIPNINAGMRFLYVIIIITSPISRDRLHLHYSKSKVPCFQPRWDAASGISLGNADSVDVLY